MLVRRELAPVSSIYELGGAPVVSDEAKALTNDLSIEICRYFRMLVGEVVNRQETRKRRVHRINILRKVSRRKHPKMRRHLPLF
jgi:hypothetical protein